MAERENLLFSIINNCTCGREMCSRSEDKTSENFSYEKAESKEKAWKTLLQCSDAETGNAIEYATIYLMNSCLSISTTFINILNHCKTNLQDINKIKMTKTFSSSFHNPQCLGHHKSSIHRVRCLSFCEMSNPSFPLLLVADSISLLHNFTLLLSIPAVSCHHVLVLASVNHFSVVCLCCFQTALH